MYRFLLTPRWLALHLVVLLVIPAFVFLGRWQFGRFEEHSALYERTTANLAATPVVLTSLDSVGASVPDSVKFRSVTVTGRFDVTHELLVRRRSQNSSLGFYVITPLVTGAGQAVLVNRGWVAAGATADAVPEVPRPPDADVTVTGRLRPSETEDNSGIKNRPGLPPRQILLINTRDVGATLPYHLFGGFVELTAQRPAAATAPEPVPEPDPGGGGGLNFAYGVQWWLFILIAAGGWFFLIRREAKDLEEARTAESSQTESPAKGPEGKISALTSEK